MLQERDRAAASALFVRLRELAARRPEAAAIVAPGADAMTYAELLEQVVYVRATLDAAGLRAGRIALVLPRGAFAASAVLALCAVAPTAPFEADLPDADVAGRLRALRPACVIVPTERSTDALTASLAEAAIPLVRLVAAPSRAGAFALEITRTAEPVAESAPPDEAVADGDAVALLLQTSGTTARPKRVPLTHATIAAIAAEYARVFDLGPDDRCLQPMGLAHTHGLYALFATIVAGGSIAVPPSCEPHTVFAWMRATAPTWLTAVPTVHLALVEAADAHAATLAKARLRFVRSSASVLAPALLARIETAFRAPVVETYGLTECSLVTISRPGRRKPGSVGTAASERLTVAIHDAAGRVVAANEPGEIVLRGAYALARYDDDVDADAFRDGWFRTGDRGYLDADGFLFVTGRSKEAINRGGEEIAPAEIDAVLLTHKDVIEAVAFGVPHAALGWNVAAVVVLRAGAVCTASELRVFAGDRLAPARVPFAIVVAEAIPKSANGKYQRRRLAQHFAPELARAAYAPPRTARERDVVAIWSEILGVPTIGIADTFFELGGTSLAATRMLIALGERTGVVLPTATLLLHGDVASLAALVDRVVATAELAPEPLVVPLRRTGAGPAFFWLHNDFEHGGIYARTLARAVEDMPFYAVAPHGLDGAPMPETIEELAADIVARLRALVPHGPYVLGGFCAGGVIAVEAARRLRAEGETVTHVILWNTIAKNARLASVRRLVAAVPSALRTRTLLLANDAAEIAGRARRGGIAHVRRAIARRLARGDSFASTPASPSSRAAERAEAAFRKHRAATARYLPPRYDGAVLLVVGEDEIHADPTLGWGRRLARLTVVRLPGDRAALISTELPRACAAVVAHLHASS